MEIAVLKIEGKHIDKISYLADMIGKAIDGQIFVLPLNSEILFGDMAEEALEATHQIIHQRMAQQILW